MADTLGVDAIAVASHGGPTLARRVFGGTIERLMRMANVPVLIVPAEGASTPGPLHRVLVSLNHDAEAPLLLPVVKQAAIGARVWVHGPAGAFDHDLPVERTDTFDEPADLVVVPFHRQGLWRTLMHGFEQSRQIRTSTRPLLLVPMQPIRVHV
jgi:nucleotide-binding universal stress UspA family protein